MMRRIEARISSMEGSRCAAAFCAMMDSAACGAIAVNSRPIEE
jgi:hypothetical protein